MSKLSKQEVLAELWRRGNLSWKLHKGQKELYDLYYNSTNKKNVWLCGRRLGKTFGLLVIAIEQCLRKPNSIVKIVAPTKTQIDQIIRPLFKKIFDDCPKSLAPKYIGKTYIYYFPNGSEIQLAGTDSGHAEKLRGADADLAIVDEAGSCDDLKTVVNSILLPSTLVTKGKIIIAGTPPPSYEHDFIEFIEDAEAKDMLVKKPSTSNPLVTKEEFDLLVEELGGLKSDACRRELFCEIIKDSSLSVIPEFTKELEKEITKEWIKPPFYDCYVSMDLGFKDLTAVLFGYYDFKHDKVIIEDEIIFNFQETETNLPLLVKEIEKKEFMHFLDIKTQEQKKPAARISDLNPIVVQEIGRISNYQLMFSNPTKHDKDASINRLRVMLSNKKIIINPRCVTLLRHLRNVRWKSSSNRRDFARTAENGHYDCVDALSYLISSIMYDKNPYPAYYNMNSKDLFVKTPQIKQLSNSISHETLKRIFNKR